MYIMREVRLCTLYPIIYIYVKCGILIIHTKKKRNLKQINHKTSLPSSRIIWKNEFGCNAAIKKNDFYNVPGGRKNRVSTSSESFTRMCGN